MSLVKNITTVGGWTLIHRASSIVRDKIQSHILGASIYADAFSAAFKLANILRKLFAEGSFNASFLPVFAATLNSKGKEEATKLASQVMTWLFFVLSFLLIISLIGFRSIMAIYLNGDVPGTPRFEEAVSLGRICFPYFVASFFAALFGGILNAINKYALPAAVHVLLNLFLIIALFIGALWFPSEAYTMAWATCFGGIIQSGIMYFNLRKHGINLRLDFSSTMPEVKRIFKKMFSGVMGAGVWQINITIGAMMASYLPAGCMSYLNYIDHLNQFPLAILGIAFSTALLPPLTKAIKNKEFAQANKQLNLGFLFALTYTLPASALLVSLHFGITNMIYGSGSFSLQNVMLASPALAAFAIGLPSYMATKIFSTSFFASQDTRTPFIGSLIAIGASTSLMFILMPILGHVGIALAVSIASWLNAIYLFIVMNAQKHQSISAETWLNCLKLLMSTMLIYLVLAYVKTPYTIVNILIGIATFYITARLSGALKFLEELKQH